MKKEDLKVGTTVYLEAHSNAARYNKTIIESKITKVARKYFYVGDFSGSFSNTKFNIETGYDDCGECSSNWKVYLSKKDLEDKKRTIELNDKIRMVFSGYGNSSLPLEKLEAINKIIKGEN